MTELPVIAYKGFNSDLTCRGFQYAEGETYEQPAAARLCSSGFHACLAPLDTLSYYHHADGAVFHEVTLGDDAKPDPGQGDRKVASRKIKIGARVDIFGMVKVHFRMVRDRVAQVRAEAEAKAKAALASGAGHYSSGDRGTAAASGHQGTAAASGDRGTASADGPESIALAAGWQGRARGADGCWLVLAERDGDGHILGVKSVRVGGKSGGIRIKPGHLYTLVGGKVTEVQPWRWHRDQA